MKNSLKKKILMGVCSATFVSAQVAGYAQDNAPTEQQMTMNSEDQEFANKLSASAKELFMKMTPGDRMMAIKMASHTCKGQNACKGQGGCKTDTHACKGQNACKGQGGCKMAPEAAVSLAAKRTGA